SKSKLARLLHPAHRHFTVLNPTDAALVQPSHLKATRCVAAVAALVEILDRPHGIRLGSLSDQVTLAQTPAPTPPPKVARPLEQDERLRSILLNALATAVQRAKNEAARAVVVVARIPEHFLAAIPGELDQASATLWQTQIAGSAERVAGHGRIPRD